MGAAGFARAMELAVEVGDTYRAANAIYHAAMTMQNAAPDDALKLLQLAQWRIGEGSDHPRTQTLTSWLHVDSAHSLVMLDRPELARSSLAAARDGWDPADSFDRADMDHVTAQAHLALGLLESAERLAASSVRTWGDGERRDAVQAGITLAAIHVQAGEPDGLRLAHKASGVSELRSTRARDRLAPLVDALAKRPGGEAWELAVDARRVAAART
ncbi:MAG: hypothetical protein ACRDT0_03700 [Pseudonocardiaceae bacterium]